MFAMGDHCRLPFAENWLGWPETKRRGQCIKIFLPLSIQVHTWWSDKDRWFVQLLYCSGSLFDLYYGQFGHTKAPRE